MAAVATARKLAILVWHLPTKNESYLLARPALHARKLRDLELKAGHKPARGRKGAAYNIRSYREQERRWVEQAEAAYTRFVAGWNSRGPKPATKARTGGCAAGLSPLAPRVSFVWRFRVLALPRRSPLRLLAGGEPVASAVHLQDMDMM